MRITETSLLALSCALAFPSIAAAQQAEMLPEAVAEGERVDDAYVMGTGNDSGTSTIDRKEIEARTPGSGDVNQLLKIMPTVQFQRHEGLADRESIQDLRPAAISISGGRIYENLITIDGIDANTRLDISETKPAHLHEPTGNVAQTLWMDSELVGTITLRDSNVSAEYGRFTGGALDIETREARRAWGASANVSYSEDALVNYIVSDGTRKAYEDRGNELPEAPEFRKWRFGASIDMPLGERGGLLLGVNRSRADVLYFRSANYDFEPGYRSSVSDNFLISGNYDIGSDLTISGKLSYSPYESEYAHESGIDNLIVSKGGGLAAQLKLASSAPVWWNITASFAHSDTSRTAPDTNYSIPSRTTNGNVCASLNCTRGGFGDVDQTQDTYQIKGQVGHDFGGVTLRGGLDYQRVDAMRERPESNYAYKSGVTGANIVCTDGDDLTCASGEYYLSESNEYRAYRAEIGIDSIAGWLEADAALGPVDLRAGLRADYESFLGNLNVAPRLSATWNVTDGLSLTLGANRYYGRSMLAYAIRAQYPETFTYRRNATSVGGTREVGNADWYLYKNGIPASYSTSELKTPYSDELSAAANLPLFGGALRVKGIYRRGHDEFAKSLQKTESYQLENGETTTRRYFVMTNDGGSEYQGVSLEYVRTFGKHSFAFNTNFSKTKSNNDDYLTTTFDVEDEGDLVIYNGEIIQLVELLNQNQRLEFASPLIINGSWTALWLNDRVTTNVNLRYRDGFTQIQDSGRNETVDGVRYDVYDVVEYKDRINVDLNAQIDILKDKPSTLTADVRVANLLNTIPSQDSVAISQPYQYGRSFWLGLKLRY
ncbi:energy transducer TonB [Aurantiacibacter xanthus]|uniref:Energy transducer TonB n=1 Tax=Aurantiacibacter xanthus TaxID=1784712 RepID=A0A3A1P3P6_9SPHN|nr:TonB-dependent receptor plug domain-containing protein [Aurantiacibacter xanthus]RIV86109.1 energy transducer TonB [Aurantiacibacter xanthus]